MLTFTCPVPGAIPGAVPVSFRAPKGEDIESLHAASRSAVTARKPQNACRSRALEITFFI
jgi:hypothetical protein